MEAALPGLIKNLLHIHITLAEELPDDIQHTKERKPDVLKKITDPSGINFVIHIEFRPPPTTLPPKYSPENPPNEISFQMRILVLPL